MKFRILAIPATVVLLWAAAAIVGASEQAAGKGSNGQASPAAATVEKPAAVLPELKYEFDPVVDGTQITHDFAIKNIGDGPLSITQVKTG
jgi:hypothetical protein